MTRQRRALCVLLLATLTPSAAFAQLAISPQAEPVDPPLFTVKVEGKAGFIDADGKLVIAPTFQNAYAFSDGLAAIQNGGLWGFIDTKGRMVIKPRFAIAGFFSEGLASFRNEFTDPWGYIDKKGTIVIKPRFDTAEKFRNGVARVGFETLGSKIMQKVADVGLTVRYRFIDRTGALVRAPAPTHFATGARGELLPFEKRGRTGYMDSKGMVVIDSRFELGYPFSEGLACVLVEGLYGYINKDGEFAIPPSFKARNDFSEGLAGVPLEDRKWGFIDPTGKVVIPPKFGWVYEGFRHGLVEVVLDRKAGYVNKKGAWVWEPIE